MIIELKTSRVIIDFNEINGFCIKKTSAGFLYVEIFLKSGQIMIPEYFESYDEAKDQYNEIKKILSKKKDKSKSDKSNSVNYLP